MPTKQYVLRMLRLYLMWTVIYFPVAVMGWFQDEKGIVSAAVHYIRDLIFVGYGHLWFLNALIVAVVIVSFCLHKKIKPSVILLAACCMYGLGLLAQSWFGLIVPLRERMPLLWFALKQVKKVIVTTRNGLFEGFLFVAMGMYLAFYDVRIGKMKAFSAFLGFFALASVEKTVLDSVNFVREDVYFLSMAPAVFFLCAFLLQVELPDSPVYRHLRDLSILIFYFHLWFLEVVKALMKLMYPPLIDTCVPFVLTLLLSVIVSEIVITVSRKPKFAWVKRLYC